MIKVGLFLLLTAILFFNPVQSMAEQFSGLSCDNNSYCKDGRWWTKRNCHKTVDCQKDPLACDSGLVCTCDVNTTNEPCNEANPNEGNAISNALGKVKPPGAVSRIGFGAAGISNFLSRTIEIIYVVGGIIFLFMMVWGALEWISSGGDKEKVGNARKRITHAIIGVVLLALTFLILRVIGDITGFKFFK